MNIIYVTMGSLYKPCFDTFIKNKHELSNTGFYVSDKFFFQKHYINDCSVKYLKEWDLTEILSALNLNTKLIIYL